MIMGSLLAENGVTLLLMFKPSATKPAAPDWLWTEDRQIRSTAFAEIEALAGRAFTLDAAANDAGDNAMCADFCSPSNSFLAAEHTGHIWIHAPFTKLLPFVQHYLHSKQQAPSSTSACILVPGYLLQHLQPRLANMRAQLCSQHQPDQVLVQL